MSKAEGEMKKCFLHDGWTSIKYMHTRNFNGDNELICTHCLVSLEEEEFKLEMELSQLTANRASMDAWRKRTEEKVKAGPPPDGQVIRILPKSKADYNADHLREGDEDEG